MSARDDGAVTPTAGAVTFTATPLLGHEERDITFDQPTLFIDYVGSRQNGEVFDSAEGQPVADFDNQPTPDSSPKLME
jgi:hypothetical protein